MCCAFYWLNVHPQLLLLLAFNRDEYLDRPTLTVHQWSDYPDVIAGRDLVNGGTWLGISRTGRFAFVTNFREVNFNSVGDAQSRGALPTDFLTSSKSPEEYAAAIDLQRYNGFNLVVGELASSSVVHVTNRDGNKIQRMLSGVHGVTNGQLHASWPKARRGQDALRQLLGSTDLTGGQLPWSRIFGILQDAQRPPDSEVPRTGVDWDLDVQCSSIFVPVMERDGQRYGTKSQTVLAVWASGAVEVQERSLGDDGVTWQLTSLKSSLKEECHAQPS